ncbi:MAG: hypothetical protein ACKVZJ_07765 [Phycisphaerales bacterium]
MNRTMNVKLALGMMSVVGGAALAGSGPTPTPVFVKERLLPGTAMVQTRCLPPCACPTNSVQAPTIGAMNLWLSPVTPIPGIDLYTVENVCWSALGTSALGGPLDGRIQGAGFYVLNRQGSVPRHQLVLTLDLPDGTTQTFDSGLVENTGPGFPAIEIVAEAPQVGCNQLSIRLRSVRTCEGDLNGDARVNTADLVFLLSQFGTFVPDDECSANLNRNPLVNTEDLVDFLGQFGRVCE